MKGSSPFARGAICGIRRLCHRRERPSARSTGPPVRRDAIRRRCTWRAPEAMDPQSSVAITVVCRRRRGSPPDAAPLGGRPGSALGSIIGIAPTGAVERAPPDDRSARSTFRREPAPPASRDALGAAPQDGPRSTVTRRGRCSPVNAGGVLERGETTYLTAINALVNRPQVPIQKAWERSSPRVRPRISRTHRVCPSRVVPTSQSGRRARRRQLARVARAPRVSPSMSPSATVARGRFRGAEGRPRRRGRPRPRRSPLAAASAPTAHAAGARPGGARGGARRSDARRPQFR